MTCKGQCGGGLGGSPACGPPLRKPEEGAPSPTLWLWFPSRPWPWPTGPTHLASLAHDLQPPLPGPVTRASPCTKAQVTGQVPLPTDHWVFTAPTRPHRPTGCNPLEGLQGTCSPK